MDSQAQLRNFKDFLLMYNQMTDNCFARCVDEVNSRTLNYDEETCVNKCTTKFINANHRMMANYVDVQTVLVAKRIEEAVALEKAQQAQQTPEEVVEVIDQTIQKEA